MKTRIFTAMTLVASMAFAHGEEKPGPHGGFIAMPGAFHTEVIPHKDGFHVYLLDMEFKNPTVKDSEVQAWVVSKKKKLDLTCKVSDETSFHCAAAKKLPQKGELVVKAKREQAQGNEAVYQLPLKHKGQQMSPKGHEGHQGH